MHESTEIDGLLYMREKSDRFHLSTDWKLRVNTELKKQHLKKQDLAVIAECSPGAISRILDPESRATIYSKAAQKISEFLDIPFADERKELSKDMVQLIPQLENLKQANPKDYERLMNILKVYIDRNK